MKEKLKWQLAQKIEYKWWQNYLKNKDTTAYLKWKKAYWQQVLATLSAYMPLPAGQQVLDAGCGPAGIFIVLEGNTVHALDPLLDKYSNLPHFQPAQNPWVKFKTMPLETLDAVEQYDVIFCMNAINHVNDVERCYDNLVKALKPGGYMVVSTDAHRFGLVKKMFQLIPGDVLHPVQLDNAEYNSFLEKRELEVIKSILYKRERIFDYYITVAKKGKG